jgi:CubicO group peptidase (beta-lactamase class C family)
MKKTILLFIFLLQSTLFFAQSPYFPPLVGSAWETTTPASLGWCTDKIDPLYTYLEQTNTKAFIVLKDGKIVLEKYFSAFNQDSLWYWASAGKTMTSMLIGIAQEEGKLSIQDQSSKYLGKGWTSLAADKEDLITVRNQLTMTTGLEDNGDCTTPSCLVYKADAGTRWAYHNAPYTLLDKVIEGATGMTLNQYYTQKMKLKIGMNGLYYKFGENNVNISTPRSMARFGLLLSNKGKWNATQVIPENYFHDAVNTSQSLNNSYGYLTWLNGKSSFMVPTLQTVFSGSLAKDAPDDMYSALGKNGQLLNVIPSMGLVTVRMGNSDGSPVPIIYNNSIWQKLNEIIHCIPTANEDIVSEKDVRVFPNPTSNSLFIETKFDLQTTDIQVFNSFGTKQSIVLNQNKIDVSSFSKGFYFLKMKIAEKEIVKRFLVL